ncbi:MAG: hypothetical protein A3H69_02000 [Candidatus Sungbacteria bacterium RIFCSPLOWO2_02_FULL_47_9]|uniref:4'-phosphopantetheinyl transferase domain-containing protein n=1 Tax=Candidatus Sungbacteria bacterium RIFCSPHIGHO2_01_FULL_47_32 TaxID=1802264 RepID=A0A1G2K6S6_9BACT|nr:MAG: Holo-[acyl-carrier-protein] synthase [Parcubacteria group bacterium GW2011_GWA2_47_10]OGZ95126.1 MAG: hypothetical protein A2633_06355 [Candidatus Sungbacteria bacterium RIFCSPHIGHO2_01_FULL_47_32]OGZ98199.1 MAG: hypothetical protein A3D57_03220 [Candidatus Sungbacteria bacterium RIFCSPHIGHO2_02_FULL_46_12]OHA05606.1 MAG: hypothetical protein A3A28_00350 [Candidatus Sungbacteria bacterium RIFCSPLOWO2_01_FULL_47_32]OHA12277.1 MAG: hypothetical protein A3H69_02000 [Candidatus Sungbacteria
MVGIDIIKIDRFRGFRREEYGFWRNVFTHDEWGGAFASAFPARRLAGVFACKEAVMKAVGSSYLGRFDKISVNSDTSGKPFVRLSDDDVEVSVSISHEKEYAVAFAIKIN